MDLSWLSSPETWISLLTLTLLEVVLGIDNLVFISILAGKLPKEQQEKARKVGLGLALITRILLLLSLTWLLGLTRVLVTVAGYGFSGRDLILLFGGLFLIGKATHEVHEKLEGEDGGTTNRLVPSFTAVIVQIMLLDVVFSLDSVITAAGMAKHLPVMIAAVVIAVVFMMVFSNAVSKFIEQHPTIKILALSFLILIGVALVAESTHKEIPKGYIYFAMAFSVAVEMLNIQFRKKKQKVELHQPYR